MSMQRALRQVVDFAELRVRLQIAEQAVCAAKELLARLDTDLEKAEHDADPDTAAGAGGTSSGNRLIPVTDWPKFHLWPPVGGLRHLIFNASTNGFDAVVRKIGDRVLIDEQAFFEWARKQPNTTPALPQPTKASRSRRARR